MADLHLPKKIGLLGPYGSGNLGDAAIQQAMIQNLCKHFPGAQVYGISLNPEDTEKRHGIPSFSIGRMGRYGWLGNKTDQRLVTRFQRFFYRLRNNERRAVSLAARLFLLLPIEMASIVDSFILLKGFDLLIVSGGGQLDDYWGGPWHHPYSMLLWAILAKLRKMQVLFVSVGAGPLDFALSRFMVRAALSLAGYRSFRDVDSKRFIQGIGFQKDDPVYPDLAFSLITDHVEPAAAPLLRPAVGVGPISYFDPRIWPESDQAVYDRYLEKLAQFVAWLIERKCTVVFLIGDILPDQDAVQDVLEILKKKGVTWAEGQLINEPIATVDELLAVISITDVVVASRFHGVLLSQFMGKPVIALSYHPKVDSLMIESGQAENLLSIDQFTVDMLTGRFLDVMRNFEQEKRHVEQAANEKRIQLSDQYEQIFNRN
jgi:polysaccharide pyruvyl transferase WcaK-like protein